MKTFWSVAALIAYGFVCGVSGALTVLLVLCVALGRVS
jgi:hypothetical protein